MVDYLGHLARMESAREDGHVRKFTWQELSKLNQRHNAHVAVRGKVRAVAVSHRCYLSLFYICSSCRCTM